MPGPQELLLHRKEIDSLVSRLSEKGLTLVPTRIYIKGNKAKVEVALAKGKKQYDKRETMLRRETEREMERAIKNRK